MEKLVERHIKGQDFWVCIPNINTNLPTNQGSPLKLHCIMFLHKQKHTPHHSIPGRNIYHKGTQNGEYKKGLQR